MAHIFKRTDVGLLTWEARIRRVGFPSQSKLFETKGEATHWAREIERSMAMGHFAVDKTARHMTLAEALQKFLDEHVPTLKSSKPTGTRCRQLMRFPIAKYALSNITRAVAGEFRDGRLKQVSGSTVIAECNVLGRAIEHVSNEHGVSLVSNPFHDIRKPKGNHSRDRRLSIDEEDKLLTACRNSRAPYLAPIVIVAIETGMRQSEILAIKWKHLNRTDRTVLLPDTKNGTQRTVPLSTRALEAMDEIANTRRYAYQWKAPDAVDGPFAFILDYTVRHAFMRARNRAGLPDLRFHDLRHEATSRLFERGFNVLEVSSITGHKTLQMLKRYTHLRAADLALRLG